MSLGSFLRLVEGERGAGGGEHRLPTIKQFSVSLSFLKSEGPDEKPPSFPRDIRRTSQA